VRSIVVLGILFGFLYETVKNLWTVIVAHTTWDLYLMLFPPSFLDPVLQLTFLIASSVFISGTLGLSIILGFGTSKAPVIIPLGPQPEKPEREAITLNHQLPKETAVEKTFPRSSSYDLSEIKFCPNCGKTLLEGFLYCPYCGISLRAVLEGRAAPLRGPPPPIPKAPSLKTAMSKTDVEIQRLYERLVGVYRTMDRQGKFRLDKEIQSYVNAGLSREEAVIKIAREMKLI